MYNKYTLRKEYQDTYSQKENIKTPKNGAFPLDRRPAQAAEAAHLAREAEQRQRENLASAKAAINRRAGRRERVETAFVIVIIENYLEFRRFCCISYRFNDR